VSTSPSTVVCPDEAATAFSFARWLHKETVERTNSGRLVRIALSGGKTPWAMLRAFVALDPPWDKIDLFQVDERFVAPSDPLSNAGKIWTILPDAARFHPIPIDLQLSPELVAQQYEKRITDTMGQEPVFDIVHLGLGEDGHTASLVPGDLILEVANTWVAATRGAYQGVRRISLTYPTLVRAERLGWLVTGSNKKRAVQRFLKRDPSLPAARLPYERASLFVDATAWGPQS
jgi:6-phosphogluconolactonase